MSAISPRFGLIPKSQWHKLPVPTASDEISFADGRFVRTSDSGETHYFDSLDDAIAGAKYYHFHASVYALGRRVNTHLFLRVGENSSDLYSPRTTGQAYDRLKKFYQLARRRSETLDENDAHSLWTFITQHPAFVRDGPMPLLENHPEVHVTPGSHVRVKLTPLTPTGEPASIEFALEGSGSTFESALRSLASNIQRVYRWDGEPLGEGDRE